MIAKLILMTLLGESPLPTNGIREMPEAYGFENTPSVFLVSSADKRLCPTAGTVCVAPGGSSTMIGVEVVPYGPPLTVLARGVQVATEGSPDEPSLDQPWQVEMVARFKAPSTRVPILVVLFDRDDAESLARKEAKLLWTVNMEPGRELGMRFLLTPEDGFEPSHTYLARVVQMNSPSENILAEGDFHLE